MGFPEISGTVEMNSTGAMSLPRGDTAYRGGRGRGIFAGGNSGPSSNTIEYITISTEGDAKDFGDLTTARYLHGIMCFFYKRTICWWLHTV